MKHFITFSSFYFLLFLFACHHHSKYVPDYKKISYDTSKVTILNWDTSNVKFPKNSDPLPLSQIDIQVIDSLLRQAVIKFNVTQKQRMNQLLEVYNLSVADSSLFYLELNNFKLVYYPYCDVNGNNIVEIEGFCNGNKQSKKFEEAWGKNSNYCHFYLTIDLKQGNSSEISINYNFG